MIAVKFFSQFGEEQCPVELRKTQRNL